MRKLLVGFAQRGNLLTLLVLLVCLMLQHSLVAQSLLSDSNTVIAFDEVDFDSLIIQDSLGGVGEGYGDEYDDDWDSYDYEEEEEYYEPMVPSFAEDLPASQVELSDETWEKIRDGRSYEQEQPPAPPQAFEGWNFDGGFLDSLSTLAWVLMIGLLLFGLGYMIYKNQQLPDTSLASTNFSINDQLLSVSRDELDNLLSKHLADGDYREAIRYRFGTILQQFRDKQVLRWVPGKTNEEYLKEAPDQLQPAFGVLAKAFSFAYYSGRAVTENHYKDFERLAENTEQDLSIFHLQNSKRR